MDWIHGDMLGHEFPTHAGALQRGGEPFLTSAFQAAGSLASDNRVTRITRFEEWRGGSTGRKALLSLVYERPEPGLPQDLFVKFSRDFDDPIRDQAKVQMEAEVRFALLSRLPDFPIATPICLFADYELETGTGILITERIPFGEDGAERHYAKCKDFEMPDPAGHYDALVVALARLAAWHRGGRFPENVMQGFEADARKVQVSNREPYTAQQIANRVARYADFAERFPRLLPPLVRSESFLAKLAHDAPRFSEHTAAISEALHGDASLRALCHWNANVDNAWFWRNGEGRITCGLMDWGNVGQMNLAIALAGCLMAAEPDFVVHHLDRLLALLQSEFAHSGGGSLDIQRLKNHFALHIATSGLMWLLDAPVLIERHIPDLADVESRFDPRIWNAEFPRTQLHMLTVFLTLWDTLNFGGRLDQTIINAR